MRTTLALLILVLLAFAAVGLASGDSFAIPAGRKPDFSGEWVFSKEKSRLGEASRAALERAVVRIDHREPTFTLDRTFVIDGQESHAAFSLTTDGKAVEISDGARRESLRMYWDGDILAFSERTDKPLGEGTIIVRYQLLEGGRVLIGEERATGPKAYQSHWVFERAGSDTRR